MQKISIVKMKKEDVGAVFEIEKLVHPNHHWSKDSFYNEISNNLAHYYCAKNEDGIKMLTKIYFGKKNDEKIEGLRTYFQILLKQLDVLFDKYGFSKKLSGIIRHIRSFVSPPYCFIKN